MDATKRLFESLSFFLLAIYFILFPFGQLLRIPIIFLGRNLTLHPIDIIANLSIPAVIFARYKFPKFTRFVGAFFIISLFSTMLSFFYFDSVSVIIGSFYLFRLFSYFIFFVLVYNLIKKGKLKKDKVLDILVFTALATAIFGWIQYFFVFDIRSLQYIGWDDHLGRIVGTFFDPGFIGIILLLGFIVTSVRFLENKTLQYFLGSLIFMATIAFTYSRATYIAFFVVLVFIALRKKIIKYFVILASIFLVLLILVPRIASEGTRLERTASIFARVENYQQTLEIIKRNPLFGVGFNNLCPARISLFKGDVESHACSGSDSSVLLIFSTTGIIGLIVFLYVVYKIYLNLEKGTYGLIFMSSSVAIFSHSIFVQSLFYPWVMGWMGILLAVCLKKLRSKSNF